MRTPLFVTREETAQSCLESSPPACSSSAFLPFIKHERARVNRIGGEFGLVLWELDESRIDSGYARAVMRRIRESMRTADVMGWVDDGQLGVLLPSTGADGARSFAAHAASAIAREAPPPSFTILSFPKSWDQSVQMHWEDGAVISNKDSIDGDLFQRVFPRRVPFWKRSLDVAGSLFGLIVLSPFLILIAGCIMLASPGPALYRQKRIGRGGKSFTFLKFRTMHPNSDVGSHRAHLEKLIKGGAAPMNKLDEKRDPRIIRGGGFLRKTSLDELPQLVNVLRGEMSLVGPRPCIPYEAKMYLRWHANRFDSLPGMTGLWQVSGKNKLSFEQMIRLDITYTKRASLALDLGILLRTLPTVVGLAVEAFAVKARSRRARRVEVTENTAVGS
jgi:lipopolysaccharide/colanic/teichoic acid biosynthesis glycosyltransferase